MIKKKIIIFTSTGGNGHMTVTKALQENLSDTYEIVPLCIFSDVLGSLDPAQICSKKNTGEQLYNYLLARNWTRLLGCFYPVGFRYYKMLQKRSVNLIERCLREHKADMVISVIVVVNGAISVAAERVGIPFLLVPTDFDGRTFINGIVLPKKSSFAVSLPLDDAAVRAPFDKAHVPRALQMVTGFAVRNDFFKSYDKEQIKERYGLVSGKPVLVIMLGSQGSRALYTIAKRVTQCKTPLQVIVCVGRYTQAIQQIESLVLPGHITMKAVGFTNDIASLLAIADLLFTKSGSVSFAEGLYMHVPMLLDATSTVLVWERLNHKLVKKYDIGVSIQRLKDIACTIDRLLADPANLARMRSTMVALTQRHGGQEVKKLVDQMLAMR